MTGLEIMDGLSYVDEKYIQEAETATLGRNTPWMKLVSVAACLCILAVGAYAYRHAGATEGAVQEPAAMAPAADEVLEDITAGGAPFAPAEETVPATAAGETYSYSDEPQHIAAASLRIVSVEDDYWVAVVEEISDETAALKVGMEVTVVIRADEVPETDEEIKYGCLLPKEGMLAKIEDGTYVASTNTLYVTRVTLEE